MDECLGVILEYSSSRLNQRSQKLNSFVCMCEARSKLKVPPCVSGIKLGSSSICGAQISVRELAAKIMQTLPLVKYLHHPLKSTDQ